MHGSDLDELHTCLICIGQSEVDGQQNPKENQQNSINKFKSLFVPLDAQYSIKEHHLQNEAMNLVAHCLIGSGVLPFSHLIPSEFGHRWNHI